tara:strand:+ start:219 stop:392 length:174 start_codon:yes stop_codon:yes gene_type:complete
MKVKELIQRLAEVNQDKEIIFYYLKDNNLNECQLCHLETILECDGRVEMTIEDISDD